MPINGKSSPPVSPALCREQVEAFRAAVYGYFRTHGRRFPWRSSTDPYRILVSEIMLQQTQAERVRSKYVRFVQAFPDFRSLAHASLGEVLEVWQGLGYNRRALALSRIAREVVDRYGGTLPRQADTLITFPGIGKASASSIAAFAFNEPTVFIETNIRAVFIHFFFQDREGVCDSDILPLVECTLDRGNPRRWYSALMDYGTMIKKTRLNPCRRSFGYRKQSRFEGSDRQVRGAVLRVLTGTGALTADELARRTGAEPSRVAHLLEALEHEGLICRRGDGFMLP